MTDIAMCLNKECQLRMGCYRFTAPVTPLWQAYNMEFKPDENGVCEDYWGNGE